MKLTLPPQPPPKISGTAAKQILCSEDLLGEHADFVDTETSKTPQSAKAG